jgi:hypothetical protein
METGPGWTGSVSGSSAHTNLRGGALRPRHVVDAGADRSKRLNEKVCEVWDVVARERPEARPRGLAPLASATREIHNQFGA